MTQSKVVLVTGASRGLGRGIARQFGALGATVYLTSRHESAALLAQTAAQVDAGGGRGIAVSVDQRDRASVQALVDRIRNEQGRLDILVNNAAAVVAKALTSAEPFWKKPLEVSDMIDVGLRTNYIMAYLAAPLMVETPGSLIANISFYGAVSYFHGPAYGAAKAGTDKMSFDMAEDLRPDGVACVSFWPGLIYSDEVASYVASAPEGEARAALEQRFATFEHPEFSACVLNALHEDPALMSLSGSTLIGAELGARYGISDIDGKQPLSYRDTMGGPSAFILAR
ncbi:SDR family NAD(P)-dependent oxidoreductase [Sphingomonas cavernae]|uniref:SDR family NAD(P)-dependent oxidoreductase n=1 Tax=Sphingomonas cavernae TaxID=2320861 RepID=A0A418WND1_9SPHN|nr:SDR family NAD(P)-dependent oxidoreductase [Sphingomonas cavernae]RJF91514.1 SDR family NAD(P)-dependent oxidoreductase [Sphingomonas cavernae]